MGTFVKTVKTRKWGRKPQEEAKGRSCNEQGTPAQPTGTEPTDKQKLELEHEQKGTSDMSNSLDKGQTRPDKKVARPSS